MTDSKSTQPKAVQSDEKAYRTERKNTEQGVFVELWFDDEKVTELPLNEAEIIAQEVESDPEVPAHEYEDRPLVVTKDGIKQRGF